MSIHYDLQGPSELHPELALLWATLEDGTREWLENVDPEPTAEAMTWHPYPHGPSIGGILLHMIAADKFWINDVILNEELDLSHPALAYDAELDQDNVQWPVPPAESWDWYFDLFTRSRVDLLASLLRVNDPLKTLMRPSGNTFTVRWILAHLVEHDSYHAGQIVALHEMYKRTT